MGVFTINDIMGFLIGLVSPPVISALKNKNWPMWKKMATVGGVSLALSALTLYLTTQEIVNIDLKQMTIAMIATALPAYKLIWEGTKIDQQATELNILTNTKETVKDAVEEVTKD